jgi:hypothetical protein
MILLADLEQEVMGRLLARLTPENVDAIVAEAQAQAPEGPGPELTATLAGSTRTERGIGELMKVVTLGRKVGQEALREAERLQAELDALQAKRAGLEGEPAQPATIDRATVLQVLAEWAAGLRANDVDEKRRVLRAALEQVIVSADALDIYYRSVGMSIPGFAPANPLHKESASGVG